MMFLHVLTAFLLLNVVSSYVLFTHSVMYDTQDFIDNPKITLPSFCSTSGCDLYVAPIAGDPYRDGAYAASIKIYAEKIAPFDNNDLRYASSLYQKNGAKQPTTLLPLLAGSNYYIQNSNMDATTDQMIMITVYVVSRAAPNFPSSLVYDSTRDVPNPLPASTIMLLDNTQFRLEISPSTKMNSVVMRTVGFDNADGKADGCNFVLDTNSTGSPFPGVAQQLITTPILTMMFDSVTDVVIKRSPLDGPNFYLDDTPYTGFITSSGYVGCSAKSKDNAKSGGRRFVRAEPVKTNSLETLRTTSYYNPVTVYYITSPNYYLDAEFDLDLNTPETDSVMLTLEGRTNSINLYGLNHDMRRYSIINFASIKVEWNRLDTATFMARFSTGNTTVEMGSSTVGGQDTTTSKGAATSFALFALLASVIAMLH